MSEGYPRSIGKTTSLYPVCLQRVEASIIAEKDEVFLNSFLKKPLREEHKILFFITQIPYKRQHILFIGRRGGKGLETILSEMPFCRTDCLPEEIRLMR